MPKTPLAAFALAAGGSKEAFFLCGFESASLAMRLTGINQPNINLAAKGGRMFAGTLASGEHVVWVPWV